MSNTTPQPLRIGVRYRRADGSLTLPLRVNHHWVSGKSYPFCDLDTGFTYTHRGAWHLQQRYPDRDLVADEFVEAFENHPPDSVTVRRAFTQLRNTLKNP